MKHQPFVLLYRPGPAWLAGRSVFEQPLAEHLAYMRSLLAQESLMFGGPFLDDSGGVIAIDAASMADAMAVRDADPAVRDGVMLADVRPWKPLARAW